MSRNSSNPGSTFRSPPAPGLWAVLSDMVVRLRHDLCSAYRPERHYMRGPGPAWHAKQAA